MSKGQQGYGHVYRNECKYLKRFDDAGVLIRRAHITEALEEATGAYAKKNRAKLEAIEKEIGERGMAV